MDYALLQNAIAAYQNLVTAAEVILHDPDATRLDITEARGVIVMATNMINDLAALTAPQSQRIYHVKIMDTLLSIAQKELGSWRLYQSIKDVNGMIGDAIYMGQVLILPVGNPPASSQ